MNEVEKIHQEALLAVKHLKHSEVSVIDIIQTVYRLRVFHHKGYKSLYEYCVKALVISEGSAYSYIAIAKASLKVSELLEALRSDKISLSHAKTLAPVISQENKLEWLELAQTLSVRELEKEVVKHHPKVASKERIRPLAENLSNLECIIDDEIEDLIRRAQELLCQKQQEVVNIKETLRLTLQQFVQRNDPLLKKTRRPSSQHSPRGKKSENIPYNQPLSDTLKRAVLQRDRGKCQAKDPKGNVCGDRKWLDIHHIQPRSQGGTNDLDNLITLCGGHHKLIHQQMRT